MKLTKIVITGGPCAGKTTAMSRIQKTFSEKGYRVLFVPETATELITGGIAPWTCRDRVSFQTCLLKLQNAKERAFEEAARTMDAEKVLIVCDRGALDSKAYITPAEFQTLLQGLNENEVELRDSYDAVFHLVTAAKGAEEFYTTANNGARTETPEEAALLDDKLIAAWTGHPHLRVIDNRSSFELKIKRLLSEIAAFLGEPEPFEIERKFLIAYPDVALLEQKENCRRVDIIQTYLKAEPGSERRIRQRGEDGHYLYYETIKQPVNGMKRVEIERRLTEREYLRLLMESDPACHPIRKTRYCLTMNNTYYEIDLYPFWKDQAIMEVEMSDETEEIEIPSFIQVIREVTEDENYKNAALAHFPLEADLQRR